MTDPVDPRTQAPPPAPALRRCGTDLGPQRPRDDAGSLEEIEADFDRMDSALAALDAGDLEAAEALGAELGTTGGANNAGAGQDTVRG